MQKHTKTSYRLEMHNRQEFHPKTQDVPGLRIEKVEIPCPELNKFFHTLVGYDYQWGGRSDWGRNKWYDYADRDELETWIAYMRGTPAGYFELEKQPNGDVQIPCIGLLPQFVGKGLGGVLLTRAVERAWELSERAVFLRTCSLDHPHALHNYLARGFHVAETKTTPINQPTKSFWEMAEDSL